MGRTKAGAGSLPAGVLESIEDYLGCTWIVSGSSEERQLAGLVEDGIAYLDGKFGASGDYTVPGFPRQLLKEYVRYARDAALDVFENNYLSLITAMQNQRRVGAYELESAGAAGS